jgi:hypothetical protein
VQACWCGSGCTYKASVTVAQKLLPIGCSAIHSCKLHSLVDVCIDLHALAQAVVTALLLFLVVPLPAHQCFSPGSALRSIFVTHNRALPPL